MTVSSLIGVILITHGNFGKEILHTAQEMVGAQEQALGIALTHEMGAEGLTRLLVEAQKNLPTSQGILYLVDMLGGTPCNVVLLQTKDHPAEVVTGVNLYMALSAFKNRQHMDLKTLAARVAEDGRKSILLPKDLLAKKAGA